MARSQQQCFSLRHTNQCLLSARAIHVKHMYSAIESLLLNPSHPQHVHIVYKRYFLMWTNFVNLMKQYNGLYNLAQSSTWFGYVNQTIYNLLFCFVPAIIATWSLIQQNKLYDKLNKHVLIFASLLYNCYYM